MAHSVWPFSCPLRLCPRVSIARMLLKNPSIVFCDEATSSLDSATEHALLANLREVTHGRTTVVIAHRLSTIVDADVILVLDNGVVKESGTHYELLADPHSRYASMWRLQSALSQTGKPELLAAAMSATEEEADETTTAAATVSVVSESAQERQQAVAAAVKEQEKSTDDAAAHVPSLSTPANATTTPSIEATAVSPPSNATPTSA